MLSISCDVGKWGGPEVESLKCHTKSALVTLNVTNRITFPLHILVFLLSFCQKFPFLKTCLLFILKYPGRNYVGCHNFWSSKLCGIYHLIIFLIDWNSSFSLPFCCRLKIFVPIACLAFTIMVPVNWTNGTLERSSLNYSNIDKLSISNIPIGSRRYAAEVF